MLNSYLKIEIKCIYIKSELIFNFILGSLLTQSFCNIRDRSDDFDDLSKHINIRICLQVKKRKNNSLTFVMLLNL